MRRFGSRWVIGIVGALLAAAVAFPLGVIASHTFSDVPNSNTFHQDIAAIAAAGVTQGCGPTTYCPKEFVTREQMAAFMNRLGALGPGKVPVVNATKLDGLDSTDFLGVGPIVQFEAGPWLMADSGSVTLRYGHEVTVVTRGGAGDDDILVVLQGPGTIDGVGYGFASAEVCYSTSDTTITAAAVTLSTPGANTGLVFDGTDRPMVSSTCFVLTDATPEAQTGRIFLELDLSWPGAGSAIVGTVKTTWAPLG
jgi:hypothetical protein